MTRLVTQHTPPPPTPDLWIQRLKDNDRATVIILAPLYGVFYHWLGKGSGPHLEPKEECVGCQSAAPLKWHGYFHCWDHASKRQFFLEVTANTVEKMTEKSAIDAPDFRGCRFTFKRGAGARSRVTVEYLGRIVLTEAFPEGRAPVRELEILWKIPAGNGEHKTDY